MVRSGIEFKFKIKFLDIKFSDSLLWYIKIFFHKKCTMGYVKKYG